MCAASGLSGIGAVKVRLTLLRILPCGDPGKFPFSSRSQVLASFGSFGTRGGEGGVIGKRVLLSSDARIECLPCLGVDGASAGCGSARASDGVEVTNDSVSNSPRGFSGR